MIKTQLVKIDKKRPDEDKIKEAAQIIKRGGLVAFPTETVYGLGANALDEQAAAKIYLAKGRPQDNPLIVHIHSVTQLDGIVKEIPSKARNLMDKFWPGPLTIIFNKKDIVPPGTTGGLDTVGVRMPDNPIALALIREAGLPIAAPSANISGRPSPTNARDVYDDLSGKVDMILDGGACTLGVESTVVDVSEDVPLVLRPGGLTVEKLQLALGKIELDPGLAPGEKPRSPGQKYKHYAPKAKVTVFEGPLPLQVSNIKTQAKQLLAKGIKVGIMSTAQTQASYPFDMVVSVGDRNAPLTISANLFSVLRKFDRLGVEVILTESVSTEGLGLAVMNRLHKAAGYNIVKVGK
jgi:L-threonylcarbamoyladenylate synthase